MSANEMKKAYVTAVPFGSLTIEGLMDDEGKFYVAVPQIADLIETSRTLAARDLKRMMGEGFETSKFKTEFTQGITTAVSIEQFESVILEYAVKGNEKALALTRALVGLSLTQLFSDAFGIKFEVEERQGYARAREVHRVNFRPKYTDHLKNDGCKNYGKEVNRLKLSAGVPLEPLTEYKQDELNALNEKEIEYNLLRKLGYSHNKALRTI